MKIDLIVNDGSPISVTEKSISGEDGGFGVGGAELALLTMCRGWHEAGHDITLYNSPNDANGSVFKQRGIDEFVSHEDRDILIVFRSPNARMNKHAKGKKVWWSCDQHTIGDFAGFSRKVDKIVTISPYHTDYFRDFYGIADNVVSIDLPVRIWEYDLETKKVPYKVIFNSIPDRGLHYLAAAWEQIVKEFPQANLVVTSDWRLWDRNIDRECAREYRLRMSRLPNVTYLGAINRKELIKHELEAQLHLYSGIYEELFCIAVAETQVAGAFPITSNCGALRSTNMGLVLPGSPADSKWMDEFIEKSLHYLKNPDILEKESKDVQRRALDRFSLDRILDEWNTKVFNG